jgi:CPA1 family monovalent cation:H+ antiporter
MGRLAGVAFRHTRDHLMEILVSVIVAYGSAVLAELLHASPVLAVVGAGLAMGVSAWGAISPSGRVAIRSAWEVAAFGVNSVVFLLVGLQIDFTSLGGSAPAIGWGLLALFCGRVVAVYPLLALLRLRGNGVPLRWQHLLVAGNLKGGLSMALALSLPAALPHRELLVAVVFGCAFVTLLGLGLALSRIARALGIGGTPGAERDLQLQQGRLLAARAAQAELERLQQLGMVPPGVFQRLRAAYQGTIVRSERELRELLLAHSGEEARQVDGLRRHLLQVEKSAVRDAAVSGMLGDEAAALLLAESDRGLAEHAEVS